MVRIGESLSTDYKNVRNSIMRVSFVCTPEELRVPGLIKRVFDEYSCVNPCGRQDGLQIVKS